MLACLRSAAPTLVTLLCLIVLTVRLSGVHGHRDLAAGPESALHEQAHLAHGHHHDDHAALAHAAHADGQVDVKIEALIGGSDLQSKLGAGFAAVLLLVACLLLLPCRALPRPPDRATLWPAPRVHWRPPLRGPPQVSIA